MLQLLLNSSWGFEQCWYVCLGFCFRLWTCPYLHGCGFSFAGGGKVLLALSAWQWGCELLWFVVPAQQWCPYFTGWHSLWLTIKSNKATSYWTHRFLAAVRAVLQVTLKCSQSAAIVYSCGVHPVPIKKLVMIYKDGALISVWLYSLGSQLMIRPAQLKRYSYICFCAYLKDFFFSEVSTEVPVLFSTSLTALSLFNSK